MAVKPEAVAVVIKSINKMKTLIIFVLLIAIIPGYTKNKKNENKNDVYKKRVLESTEIDFLTSYYFQDGKNAAVTGGIGKEKLSNLAPAVIISIPLNDDDILTIDAGISSYTSASSNNLDPFNMPADRSTITGSPWVEASGASKYEVLKSLNIGYSHSSDNRDNIWSTNINISSEYDYKSFGFGGAYTRLFNEKNTEISIKGNVYLDTWDPQYPIELRSFINEGKNLNIGFFKGIDIFNENGNIIDKNGTDIWSPFKTSLMDTKKRDSFALSLNFSQIINKNTQFAIFFDIIHQSGWLSSPLQRVYFGDKDNYYIGNPSSIEIYTTPENIDVFHLADDIERLPKTRLKIPIGTRLNYYINEAIVLRTYYRYYFDNWGIISHTANIEIPIKISDKFTLYPSYRFYSQTASDYFAPYEQNLSSQEFYTSDYDLSNFNSNQYGFGISYSDIFANFNIWKIKLKRIDLRYNHYKRNTGLVANIISTGFKFIFE